MLRFLDSLAFLFLASLKWNGKVCSLINLGSLKTLVRKRKISFLLITSCGSKLLLTNGGPAYILTGRCSTIGKRPYHKTTIVVGRPTKNVRVIELQYISAGVFCKIRVMYVVQTVLWVVACLLLQWNAPVLLVTAADHPSTATLLIFSCVIYLEQIGGVL